MLIGTAVEAEGLSGPIITFDESYVRRLFSRITIFDDKVVFAVKDGKKVTIKESSP